MYITGNPQCKDWITIKRLLDTFKIFYTAFSSFPHAIEIVTLIPRFPLSANNCAMEVSNTRQSEFKIADETPSWIERGIASHVRRLLCPFNSSLSNISIYMLSLHVPIGIRYFNCRLHYNIYIPVSKVFCLFSWTNQLNNCKKLLMSIILFLFFKH